MEELKREENNKFTEEESVNFLVAEYKQSFEQLRHYDRIQNSLINYSFTGYTAIFSLAYAIYELISEYTFKFNFLSLLFIFSFFMGTVILLSFVRNRLYFTIIAQQINSLRNYFMNNSELNFIKYNKSYISHNNPKNFNLWSTDLIYIYIISVLNTLLLGTGIFIMCFFLKNYSYFKSLLISVLLCIFILGFTLLCILKYLKTKDEKSADEVTFNYKGRL